MKLFRPGLDDSGLSGRPLDAPGVSDRTRPFILGAAVAIAALAFSAERLDRTAALGAVVLTVGIVGSCRLVSWARHPAWLQTIPPLAYFIVVGLLRHAGGGATSGYSPLLMLPFFWLSLYGSRRLVGAATFCAAAVLIVPIVLVGAPDYPAQDWRRVVIWLSILPTVGFTVRGLVERIEHLARIDSLTGLLNRRGWEEETRRALRRADRTGTPLCLAILDLDHFKIFNDTQGHPAGDDLLRSLGSAWGGCVRDIDVLARYGGEEFCLVMPSATAAEAGEVVARLLGCVPLGQTASAGVAQRVPGETLDALVERADAALYQAKDAGRARSVQA